MKIETLRKDWQAAHPGGDVWILGSRGELLADGKQTGRFAVTYGEGGKLYTYSYKSVYALAERLGMIPSGDVNYPAASREAIAAIRAGENYTSLGGLYDTMRDQLYQETGKSWAIENTTSRDEYDRVLYTYTGISAREW